VAAVPSHRYGSPATVVSSELTKLPKNPTLSLILTLTEYPKPPLRWLHKRLKRIRTLSLPYPTCDKELEGPLRDYSDYQRLKLKESARPFQNYFEIDGQSSIILVPSDYAMKLNEVRELRLSIEEDLRSESPPTFSLKALYTKLIDHPFRDHALPEDILAILDHLPVRSLVRSVYLLNEPDPDDFWSAHKSEHGFEAVGSAEYLTSAIKLFKRRNETLGEQTFRNWSDLPMNNDLREVVFHEWSHLLKWKRQSDSNAFDKAAMLEHDGYFADDYARTSDHENWAVHLGECFLDFSGERFLEVVTRAPLRMTVCARALARAMKNVSPERRSTYHNDYLKRIGFVEESILPLALKILGEHVRSGTRNARQLARSLIISLQKWLPE
jgi:hypothetical protein